MKAAVLLNEVPTGLKVTDPDRLIAILKFQSENGLSISGTITIEGGES